MPRLKLLLLSYLLLLSHISLIAANLLIGDGHDPYQHVEVLDPQGKYRLEWLIDWEYKQVFFHAIVQTHGFVAFGLSKDKLGSKSDQFLDIAIGGVTPNGTVYFRDYHAIGNQAPVVDDKQDWILRSAWQTKIKTFLSFSRHFDTKDPQDLPINDNTVYLIWAYGKTDDVSEFPSTSTRGSYPIYLLDPDLTPWLIQLQRGLKIDVGPNLGDVKVWSVQRNFDIPAKRTTYWCRIHKISLAKKHHIIGYTLNVNNETKSNVHHLLMFRCTVPNPGAIYEQYLNHPGEECYTQEHQLGQIPFQSCLEITAGFAIGGRSYFFPEEMGLPIGSTGKPEYYLFQIHYDNPEGRSDLRAEVRMDIYYTSKLRPNDGGILSIGHHVPGSPSILLPPSSVDHTIHGYCSPGCTKRILPEEGIKIVGALLHAHNAGKSVTIQHFRGGQELPSILDDRNWKFNYQPSRLLRDVATVLPGDQVKIQCYYDTTYTSHTTVGGYGADQEMCKIFALYYNRLPEYSICRSELISPDYTARYLAGTRHVTWDQPKLEFKATDPAEVAGMTLSEISDSVYVKWTVEQRAKLQNDHNNFPQVPICPTLEEIQAHARIGITPHCKSLKFGSYYSDAPWCIKKGFNATK